MNDIILKADNISKQYRLGLVGSGSLKDDLNRWWHLVRGKEDPFLKVGAVNDRSAAVSSKYVWALQDINFEVKRGEILGIIGKNGAGKSTLLKILSRVTSPTTGNIKTRGRIASLLEVGTGFHPELTGRENIFLNGAILGMTKAEIASKIDEIIEFSGCEMYINTPVKRYSSGMRVRLGFAVAAFLEPDILVVDEVLAVGDAEFQKKAIGKMQDISSTRGRTVLFVSHNMGTVKALTTRCILLKNGKIQSIGPTDEIVDEYMSFDEGNSFNFNKPIEIKKEGLKITNVSFLNKSNENCNTFICGQYLKIKVTIHNYDQKTYENCSIGIGVFDMGQSMLTSYKSDVIGVYYNVIPGENSFFCIVDKLPLSPGNYTYNINIKDYSQVYNSIKQAGVLTIESGDFFSSGKIPASSHQTVLVSQSWS